jgi:hypothetical protein
VALENQDRRQEEEAHQEAVVLEVNVFVRVEQNERKRERD